MNKDIFKGFLIREGWKEDLYGHMKKEVDGKLYRYKFQKISTRFEVQVKDKFTNKNKWVKISNGYYKDIIIENGKVTGLQEHWLLTELFPCGKCERSFKAKDLYSPPAESNARGFVCKDCLQVIKEELVLC